MPSLLTPALLLLAATVEGEACRTTPLPVMVSERSNADRARPSAILTRGETDWLFRPARGKDMLRGLRIVGGDPTMGHLTLSDGTGLAFKRDCSGARCLYSGVGKVADARTCWTSRSDVVHASDGNLYFGPIRVTVQRSGKGSRLLLFRVGPNGRERVQTLLESASPIVGLSASIRSIHGGLRTFELYRREASGTLVLTSYVFDHKEVQD